MPKYTITVHREEHQVSPVAAAICRYCKSVVLVVGSVSADEVYLPLLCEQSTISGYPCGAAMALINDRSVREILDNLAANLQGTDD